MYELHESTAQTLRIWPSRLAYTNLIFKKIDIILD